MRLRLPQGGTGEEARVGGGPCVILGVTGCRRCLDILLSATGAPSTGTRSLPDGAEDRPRGGMMASPACPRNRACGAETPSGCEGITVTQSRSSPHPAVVSSSGQRVPELSSVLVAGPRGLGPWAATEHTGRDEGELRGVLSCWALCANCALVLGSGLNPG